MGRPHIEPIHYLDVPEEQVTDGPLAGTRRRLLSEDGDSGATTATVALEAGWSGDLGDSTRPHELFVLGGELELGGTPLRAGCYAWIPQRAADGRLAARSDALLVVMAEEERLGGGGSVEVVDTADRRFENPPVAGEMQPGLVTKLLRIDDVTGDWTWLGSAGPGWYDGRVESHPTVQEAFVVRGDCLLGDRGAMRVGSYFWRPPLIKHGPLATRDGLLFLSRSKGGGLEVEYHEEPRWRELVEAHFGAVPYFPS